MFFLISIFYFLIFTQGYTYNVNNDTIESVCVPESLYILEDDTVTVSAYLSPTLLSKQASYDWEVDEGEILGTGEHIKWKASNAHLGPHEIRVIISLDNKVVSCSTIVYVGLKNIGLNTSKITNGATFLLTGTKESGGYGLYSYLLLVKAINNQVREQQLAAIMQIMSMPSVKELEMAIGTRKRINITYLPVIKNPPLTIIKKLKHASELRAAAEWVLENYDYAHAAAYLSIIPEESGIGPMFYSALVPLVLSDKIVEENHLWININQIVAPEDIELWVKEFMIQAQQEHFWEPRSISVLGLKLRMILGVMGYELPKVIKAVNWFTSDKKIN